MPRFTLVTHPPESNYVLGRMSLAADLFVDGRSQEAIREVRSADLQSLRVWFHEAQKTAKVLLSYGIIRSQLPTPASAFKIEAKVASRRQCNRVFERDGWYCRFCGIRVIDPRAITRIRKLVPGFPWGKGTMNLTRHACQAVRGTDDHVLPRSWARLNEDSNLVTACWACQFSRVGHRIEDCGIADPRDRDPVHTEWDGLLRLLDVSTAASGAAT